MCCESQGAVVWYAPDSLFVCIPNSWKSGTLDARRARYLTACWGALLFLLGSSTSTNAPHNIPEYLLKYHPKTSHTDGRTQIFSTGVLKVIISRCAYRFPRQVSYRTYFLLPVRLRVSLVVKGRLIGHQPYPRTSSTHWLTWSSPEQRVRHLVLLPQVAMLIVQAENKH